MSIIKTPLSKINFETLTLETVDFNTRFPVEYAYRLWKSHSLQGEELKETFWRFMHEFCKQYVENYNTKNHILWSYLFLWYAPELLEILTYEDVHTIVITSKEDAKNVNNIINGFIPYILADSNNSDFPLDISYLFTYWLTRFDKYFYSSLRYISEITSLITHKKSDDIRNVRDLSHRLFNNVVDAALINDDVTILAPYVVLNPEILKFRQHRESIIYYPCDLIQNLSEKLCILDAAFYFKSMNIIKYLLMNDCRPTKQTVKIAIAIGSPELIRLAFQFLPKASPSSLSSDPRVDLSLTYIPIAEFYNFHDTSEDILNWLKDELDDVNDKFKK
jgi:hypothetical protein